MKIFVWAVTAASFLWHPAAQAETWKCEYVAVLSANPADRPLRGRAILDVTAGKGAINNMPATILQNTDWGLLMSGSITWTSHELEGPTPAMSAQVVALEKGTGKFQRVSTIAARGHGPNSNVANGTCKRSG